MAIGDFDLTDQTANRRQFNRASALRAGLSDPGGQGIISAFSPSSASDFARLAGNNPGGFAGSLADPTPAPRQVLRDLAPTGILTGAVTDAQRAAAADATDRNVAEGIALRREIADAPAPRDVNTLLADGRTTTDVFKERPPLPEIDPRTGRLIEPATTTPAAPAPVPGTVSPAGLPPGQQFVPSGERGLFDSPLRPSPRPQGALPGVQVAQAGQTDNPVTNAARRLQDRASRLQELEDAAVAPGSAVPAAPAGTFQAPRPAPAPRPQPGQASLTRLLASFRQQPLTFAQVTPGIRG